MLKKGSKHKGFTLFEMVIAISIIGILAGIAAPLIYSAAKSANTAFSAQELSIQGRTTLEIMRKAIGNLASNQATDLILAGNNAIEVKDLHGNTYQFSLSGDNLLEVENGTSSILTSNASALSFTYYDSAGQSTAVPTEIHYVKINFTLRQDNENQEFSSIVFLRNTT